MIMNDLCASIEPQPQ